MNERKMLQRASGFSVIEATFVTLVVLALILGGLFIWNQSSQKTADTNSREAREDEPEEWVEYQNDEARVKFSYPKSWRHTPNEAQYFDDTEELGEVTGSLKSPTGKTIEWRYTVWGGKGGDCQPNPEDAAFADGNKCSSKTTYSAETLPLSDQPESKLLDGSKKGLVLTKTKHRASGYGQPITYQICLDDYYLSEPRFSTETRMGLLLPCEYWTTGFNVKFEAESEEAFESEEAKTAEQIMRTFDSL